MDEPLTVYVQSPHQAVLRAARRLSRSSERAPQIRPVPLPPEQQRPARWLAIGLGSRLRSTITVRSHVAAPASEVRAATALAATDAAWDGLDDFEVWRALSVPLPRAHLGQPDPTRPWVVLGPGVRMTRQLAEAVRDRWAGAQIHAVDDGGMNLLELVRWPGHPHVVGALLGRATAVVARPTGLAFDALRLGLPVHLPQLDLPAYDASTDVRFAATVPGSVATCPAYWSWVSAQLSAGDAPGGWPIDAAWYREGRVHAELQRNRGSARLQRAMKRYAKLRRDPDRFLADSRFELLRTLGKIMNDGD